MSTKQELRSAITERLKLLSDKERSMESHAICNTIKKMLLKRSAGTIGAYAPLISEPNIFPLLLDLQKQGWKIALPAYTRENMEFRIINNLSMLKKNPQWNILEPPEDCEVCSSEKLDIVLIPGRAFTIDGTRLGRGNGNYDMWLIAAKKICPLLQTIGVGFECQILEAIPEEAHDQRMTMIITGRGVLQSKNKK